MNESETSSHVPDTVAAVDLGSNSFHMIVGRLDNEQLVIVDRMRDTVRLGGGLLADKTLSPEAQERALDTLSKMGQRLRTLPHNAVRAVGTNTMRQIRDGGAFLKAAEEALGHPIEIISGREEARLVYLGVAHGLAAADQTRLVVDIGGGSTELILGEGLVTRERESLFMGCVNMTGRFFADGKISEQSMERAILAGRVELQPVRRMFQSSQWASAVGSSGTIKAIQRIAVANGWSEEGISKGALKKLRRALTDAGDSQSVALDGLADDRRPVIAGGVAVLSAIFSALNVEHMQVSEMALREGLLYELVGYIQHRDVRDSTIQAFMQRFGIDRDQASRVETTAHSLLRQVEDSWELGDPEFALMLNWASRLHEIGLAIAHSGFHKHGAYILANADLPGFTRQQQDLLAALVRTHRRKFSNAEFDGLAPSRAERAKHLAILLRLSILMHRGRSGSQKPPMKVTAADTTIEIRFPDGWLAEHPLTETEIAREAEYLLSAGFALEYA